MCKKKVLFLITLAQNERYTLLQICNPCQKSWTLMTLCTSIIRVFQGLLADTVELLNSFISVSNHVTTEFHLQLQYSPKVLGHFLHFLYSATNFHPPSPSSPETMLVFWRSTYDNGNISRARQLQVSHKRTNIVLWGRGVHVCSNYDNMWRKVVF